MSWLVASAMYRDPAQVRDGRPALWRDVRRFNAPVQLAVAAGDEVATSAALAAEAALISLAPCQSGSPELHGWVRAIESGNEVRMNPTHTLHAVDNLALSVLTMRLANHAWGMSLGGGAGMLWAALELVLERLSADAPTEQGDREAIVLAGDQESSERASPAVGVAMLFARDRTPHVGLGRAVRLVTVARQRNPRSVTPHAAAGACELLAALQSRPAGRFEYAVPATHSDGIDDISLLWDLE